MWRLQSLDVKVWVEGDRLKISAPEGALTAGIKEEMQRRKPEILSFLEVAGTVASLPPSIVPLQPKGTRLPVFGIPGHNGDVFCYVRLAAELGAEQPFYALQPPGLDGRRPALRTVEEMAGAFADDLQAFRPTGPLAIAGYCLGGAAAFETARQLAARGRTIALLALFGSPCPTALKPFRLAVTNARRLGGRIVHHARAAGSLPRGRRFAYLFGRASAASAAATSGTPAPADDAERNRIVLEDTTIAAVKAYHPGRLAGRITLYFPSEEWRGTEDRPEDWKRFAQGGVDERIGPDGCNGDLMLREYVRDIARLFAADLLRLRHEE
jgi:thioesterase domain-containing protein